MDLREHAIRESTQRWRFRFGALVTGALLLALAIHTAVSTFGPVRPPKVVTKTQVVYKERLIPLPHNDDPPVGSMTARGFRSIIVGQSAESVDDRFGIGPDENVRNDQRTFYYAAEGGTYWIYYNKAHDQKVIGKEYKRG